MRARVSGSEAGIIRRRPPGPLCCLLGYLRAGVLGVLTCVVPLTKFWNSRTAPNLCVCVCVCVYVCVCVCVCACVCVCVCVCA